MQFAVYIEDIFHLTRVHLTYQIQREPKLRPEVLYLEETEENSILSYYFSMQFFLLSTATTSKGGFLKKTHPNKKTQNWRWRKWE